MKSQADEAPTVTDYAIAEQMADSFSRHLLANPEVLSYVESRGIGRRLAEERRVGYLPPFAQHQFHIFPLLKGRVIVPIRDAHGRIIAFAGRQYEPQAKAVEKAIWDELGHKPEVAAKIIHQWQRGKWINEKYPKRRHLFQLHSAIPHIRRLGYAILVEGYFDAMVLDCEGLPNTAAMCSVQLTDYHAALLSRYTRDAVVLLDGDKAGVAALEHVVPALKGADIKPHILGLPEGFDPDDATRAYGGKMMRKIMRMALEKNDEKVLWINR